MLLITCPFGLTSLLTTELKRLGIKPQDSFPNGCWVNSTDRTDVMRINLWSRIANKVFLQLGEWKATTFEQLFQLVTHIDRSEHVSPWQWVRITATCNQSILHAPRTVQSIVHKAIFTNLTWDSTTERTVDDDHQLNIYVYITDNVVHIMKNTSGDSLHARGRRTEQGDAPIKENLAVATLLSASWPFQQALRDPCCGSGTLVIEAARLARNTCPWKERSFAFQYFPDYSRELFSEIRQWFVDKEIHNKTRTIIWSDTDKDILRKAHNNAQAAWVDDIVQFKYHDIMQETKLPELQGPATIICNPPYDKRLQDHATHQIHERLSDLIKQPWSHGAVISWYEHAENIFSWSTWKRKETRQGKERCFIYVPKWN